MLKKFFISMLGSMAAFWLSLIIFLVGSIFVVSLLVGKSLASSSSSSITGDKILYLDLSGDIPEREEQLSVNDLIYGGELASESFCDIVTAIQLATDDKDVKGLYIDCKGSALGVASRSEIIEAIKKFKAAGKWVYSYADNYIQGDYYIASVADKVFLNPVGSLDVHGLSSQVMFYKNLLEKIGVEVNVVRVGSFKSAVEPYMRMDMSEASRLQTSTFLNQIWSGVAQSIAENRSLESAAVVNNWADSLSMSWAPEKYVDQKAVSELYYRSEVEKLLRDKMSLKDDDELPLIAPSEYVLARGGGEANPKKSHIAVLYANGDIVDTGKGGIVADEIVPEILKLTKDKNVKGLVLRVNSGGGSAFASEQIWKALEDFKGAGKPFYVSMGDYAASGGYYISCGADSIFCDPATLTGSIGIFGIIPNAQKLLTDKIGLGFDTVETNENANFPSLTTAPTQKQLDCMQTYVERGYDTFTSRVAQGRGIPVDSVKAIGGGRVWDGYSALKIGLVDKHGTLADVIDAMAAKVDLKSTDIVNYPTSEMSILQTLIRESKKQISVDGIEESAHYFELISRIKNIEPVQARMEVITIK